MRRGGAGPEASPRIAWSPLTKHSVGSQPQSSNSETSRPSENVQTIGQLGPVTGGDRPARPFLELRGAELKFEHYGLPTSKCSAMVRRVMLHFRLPPAHLAKMGGWQRQDSDGMHVVAGPYGS